MEQINDSRIEQCLNDIQKYEKLGNLLAGSLTHLFNSNAPESLSVIHNVLESDAGIGAVSHNSIIYIE